MTDKKPDFTEYDPGLAATVLKRRYGVDVAMQHPVVALKTNKQSDGTVASSLAGQWCRQVIRRSVQAVYSRTPETRFFI